MTLRDRTQLIIQEWLRSHEEDHAWLRGPHGIERQAAYERVLDRVARVLNQEIGWREWIRVQNQVREIVRELVKAE